VNSARALVLIFLGFVVVVGGAMLVIYLLQGGEGDSVNIPGSGDVVTGTLLR